MNKMRCEAMKKSAKTYYFSLLKPLFVATLVVFSGLAILSGVIFSAIITTLFALFAVTIWGIFFASEIMYLNREHQWHLKEKQA
jgi:hypothetical protein